ncbi:acyl-CoA:lysophosphatidylglycerol acyltransferase 1-like [Clavelina lepadiformis]|uniref:acyl-CoA:lysophosphatidylglycerol acyltransferase 1-like n=1 Tax=Clavelina lepadiformis TaxID=159417 RepID=UPI0040422B24
MQFRTAIFNTTLLLISLPRLVVCFLQNVFCPTVYVFWFLLFQPIHWINSNIFWDLEGKVFDAYLKIVSSWLDYAGHTVYECGDDISKFSYDESIVMINHQTPNDIGTMMRALQGKNCQFRRSCWIMDWVFQFFNFGWVSKGHGDFFLMQAPDANRFGKILNFNPEESRLEQPALLEKNIISNFCERKRKWILLFPEGGLLRKRRSGSQRYAKKNGFPILQHVALPRIGAIQTIINTLGVCYHDVDYNLNNWNGETNAADLNAPSGKLKWVVDVTIGYTRPSSILEYLLGYTGPTQTVVLYRVYSAEELISKTAQNEIEKSQHLQSWLHSRFAEKEELLSYFYAFNNFPKLKTFSPQCTTIHVSGLNNKILYSIQCLVALQILLIYYFVLWAVF